MMRRYEPFLLFALLAACTPPEHLQSVGSSGFGTGATGYGTQAYGAASAVPVAPAPSTGVIPSSEINSALFGTPTTPTTPAGAVSAPAASAPLALPPAAAVPAAAAPTHTGISDEQDFQAVSTRETIESDKARIEANKAQYQQIAPTALPPRTGDSDATKLINYAVSAPNRLGQPAYQRRAVSPDAHQRACLRYQTAEAAQLAFLKAGGPERDGKKLDPDGDGFACGWDPTPFQKARGG